MLKNKVTRSGKERKGRGGEEKVKRRESVRSPAEYPQSGNWSLKCEETREASSARYNRGGLIIHYTGEREKQWER